MLNPSLQVLCLHATNRKVQRIDVLVAGFGMHMIHYGHCTDQTLQALSQPASLFLTITIDGTDSTADDGIYSADIDPMQRERVRCGHMVTSTRGNVKACGRIVRSHVITCSMSPLRLCVAFSLTARSSLSRSVSPLRRLASERAVVICSIALSAATFQRFGDHENKKTQFHSRAVTISQSEADRCRKAANKEQTRPLQCGRE